MLISKGVKQGCALAPPLIFNINDTIRSLNNFHSSILADRKVPVLLYTIDIVLLSRTPVGLKRALQTISIFYHEITW